MLEQTPNIIQHPGSGIQHPGKQQSLDAHLMCGLDFHTSIDCEQFVANASSDITLQAIRFETIEASSGPFLLVDLTLFNGAHYLVLLAIVCNINDRNELDVDLSSRIPSFPNGLLIRFS